MNPCPRCGAKLINSKVRRESKYIIRHQRCGACEFSQWAKYLPEVLVETTPVRKRTKSILSVPKSDPISTPAALSALEQ